jgi:hypothetical protein
LAVLVEKPRRMVLNGFKKVLTGDRRSLMLLLNMFNNTGGIAMFIVYGYFVYLAISLAVTVWVARTLHRRGRIFLVDAFHGHTELAESVNHLLVVGFYLINVGYVAFALKSTGNPAGLRGTIELVSDKLGLVLLVLGLMHFFNLYVFSRIRRHGQESAVAPPFPPDMVLRPAGRQQEG